MPADADSWPAHRVRVYPEDIPDGLKTHCFGGIARGIGVWARDALDFLDAVL